MSHPRQYPVAQAPSFSPEQIQYLQQLEQQGQISLQPQQQYPMQQGYGNMQPPAPQYDTGAFTRQDAMHILHASNGRPVQVEIYEGVRVGKPAGDDTFIKVIVLLVLLGIFLFGIIGSGSLMAILGGVLK